MMLNSLHAYIYILMYIDIYKIQYNNYSVKLYKGRIIIFTSIQDIHIVIYF